MIKKGKENGLGKSIRNGVAGCSGSIYIVMFLGMSLAILGGLL